MTVIALQAVCDCLVVCFSQLKDHKFLTYLQLVFVVAVFHSTLNHLALEVSKDFRQCI